MAKKSTNLGAILDKLKTGLVNAQVAHNKPTREYLETTAITEATQAIKSLFLELPSMQDEKAPTNIFTRSHYRNRLREELRKEIEEQL